MPRHSDFQEIYSNFIEQYGAEEGKDYYNAWLNKHTYDDTKAMASQKSEARHLNFDKLFRELFRRLGALSVSFYENWLAEHGFDDSIAMSLQKSAFLKADELAYFFEKDDLHIHSPSMLSGEFKRVELDGEDYIVAGYANTCIEDTYGDKFTPEMLREPAEKYMEEPIVFYCHRWSEPSGIILPQIVTDSSGREHQTHVDEVGWYVVSRVSKARPDVETLMEEGLLRGYSIGGYYVFDRQGNMVGTTIHDLSYVPKPANKLSYHRRLRSLGFRRSEKNMEKEEIVELLDERLKTFTDEINESIQELKTELGLDDIKKTIQGLRGFDFGELVNRMTVAEEAISKIELPNLEGFVKAEDFNTLQERLSEFEDIPFIKGQAAGSPEKIKGYREKVRDARDPLGEAERIARGLSS